MNRKIFSLLLLMALVPTYSNWRQDRRPKIWGDKLPLRKILPTRRQIQRNIVLYHNVFRTKVVPRAANMLRMKWHKGAAFAAQRWSDQCLFLIHDNTTGRHINNYGSCGQNIFVASEKVPWLFAIKSWFLEKDNFTYDSWDNDINVVGHYTQMVWATTHEVGCGLSRCHFKNSSRIFYNYICNYCPIGNKPGQLGRPYKKGRPCTLCKNHCHPNKKLCTNACPTADVWVNCKDLYKVWSGWLCDTSSAKGRERMRHCRATCRCKNKLHD